jgi:hypothetical protein
MEKDRLVLLFLRSKIVWVYETFDAQAIPDEDPKPKEARAKEGRVKVPCSR